MAKQRSIISDDTSPSETATSVNSADIAALAFLLWQARGCPEGSPEIDWLEAEQQLHAQLGQAASPKVRKPLLVRSSGA